MRKIMMRIIIKAALTCGTRILSEQQNRGQRDKGNDQTNGHRTEQVKTGPTR
jgi:hypothetical protein